MVICNFLRAESVYDVLQIADVCPYCGSNLVTEAGGEKGMAPGAYWAFSSPQSRRRNGSGPGLKERYSPL